MGEVLVTSVPAGAAVLVDGAATGETTPASLLLGVGPHRIAVDLMGHLATPASLDVAVIAGAFATADFALDALGALAVSSDPAGAAILLDGAETGHVTPHTFDVVAGDHLVELRLAGYTDPLETREVSVLPGETASIEATLLAAGGLAVTSTPDGADIAWTGAATGRLTPWIFNLPVGDYLVQRVAPPTTWSNPTRSRPRWPSATPRPPSSR
ncbi:MAG: PEGA domain-containing protein [bacterium]|nr:PEGA domain-containing protein [bacterium]